MSQRIRHAQYAAYAVAVLCPYCGEPQPNQSGSEMWDESDFKYTPQGGIFPDTMKCASCETRFSVAMPSKMFGATPWKL